jgi:hypothetical protein
MKTKKIIPCVFWYLREKRKRKIAENLLSSALEENEKMRKYIKSLELSVARMQGKRASLYEIIEAFERGKVEAIKEQLTNSNKGGIME